MSEISLFDHNEKAYKLLNEALKTSKFATINHATGTGKSFIALKYLYENRHKRCLYISPTYPIIDQLIDSCSSIGIDPNELNLDTMIYRSLLGKDIDELFEKYDVIILDEYHRTGAIQTYKQIKKLKDLIEQNKDDKKMIGLTATPVRYLDEERNMTNEIFNGVIASELSLAEAMLEELLPIPIVVNSKISCRTPYGRLKNKVGDLAPGELKDTVNKKLSNIGDKIDNGESDYRELLKKYIKEENGKYVVFCSTIQEAKMYYSIAQTWFPHLNDVKRYQVHSAQSKEKNREILSEFNNDNQGMSLLFCVDVLNEGVHVKNIDGVIMLRRTTSPIIYFQQIGRALSFSGRKKQIKIFDLVNNFANHNAIYAIYKELRAELQKKIQVNPNNKQKYEELISRFIIIDETREIIEDLSEISKSLTKENIIKSKVDYAVKLLENCADMPLNKQVEQNMEEANLILEKYYKFVDVEQLKALLELDILLPEELLRLAENTEENLQGYNSIYEKEKNEFNLINLIVKFIEVNKRMPGSFSTYENEKILGNMYLENVASFSEEQILAISQVLIKNNVQLEPWEKILLKQKITSNEVEQLIIETLEYIKEAKSLPKYLYESLYTFIIKYDDVTKNDEIKEILEKSDELYKKKIRPKLYERQKISEIIKQLEEASDTLSEKEISFNLAQKLNEVSNDTRLFFKYKYRKIKKMKCQNQIVTESTSSVREMSSRLKDIDDKDAEEYYLKLELDKRVNNCILRIVNFKKENGRMPSENSIELKERELASEVRFYIDNERVRKKLFDMLLESDVLLGVNIDDVIEEVANENIKNAGEREKIFLERYKSSRSNSYNEIINSVDISSMENFCLSMKTIDDEGIEKCRATIMEKKSLNDCLLRVIKFKQENNRLPSANSASLEESQLASDFAKYSDILDKKIVSEICTLYSDRGMGFQRGKEGLIESAIQTNMLYTQIKESILNLIEFLNRHGRKPLNNSENPGESEIALTYQTVVIKNLPDKCIEILNKKINEKKNFRRTYKEYIKNLKGR